VEGTLQYFEIEKFGATPKDIGIMFLVSGIVGAAVQGGVVRKYVKQGDEPKVIGIGLVFSAAGFFLLLFSSSLLNASLFLTVFSIGNNLIRPCVLSLITQKAKTGQGVATGLNSSMDSLGRIFGPLMGVTAFHLHINLPLILGGLLCLGAILLLVPFVAGERRQANEQAAG
jgi:predicted MFS family arabinose efflux permease